LFIYVKCIVLAILITNFEYLNLDEHFEFSIVKPVHFKLLVICIYRNPNSNIKIMLDNLELVLHYPDKIKD
jgi:hypothetical protein